VASCGRRGEGQARQVVLYCSVDQQAAEPIIAAFEKHTGIRVLTRFDTEATKTTGLVQRLRAESSSPAADVFWSGEVFHTIRLAGEGLLAPYDGPEAADRAAQFRDTNGRWFAFGLRQRVIAYDTRRVGGANAPRRLEDLIEARWKGRVVMAEPQFGTTGGDVASWFVHYGPDRAAEILRGLKANGLRLVQGNSTAVRMVAEGRSDVCLTDTDDVYAAQRNGWPIAMTPLDQGGAGALAIPNTAALVAGGPHPQAAAKLMAFLLGERTERMLVESDAHNTPVRAALAEAFVAYRLAAPLKTDYAAVADAMPHAIRTAMEILR